MLTNCVGSPRFTPEGSPDFIPTSPQYTKTRFPTFTPTCPSYDQNSPCANPDDPDFACSPIPTSPSYSSFFPTSRAVEDPMLINGVKGSTPHHSPCATPEEIPEEMPDFTPLPSPVCKAAKTETPPTRSLSTAMKSVNLSMQVATPIKKPGAKTTNARSKGARTPKTRPLS